MPAIAPLPNKTLIRDVGFAGSLIHLLLVFALLVAPVGTVVGVALLVMASRGSPPR